VDRPQVRTLDGFVLRRTGGCNIYEIALAGMNRLILGEGIIRITIQPALTGLRGCDHRMPARVGVFARMLVRRAIAAECDSTSLAGPQMNPGRTDLHAFFAFTALRLFNRLDRVKM
jgi:hypothetical protein